MLYNPDSVFAPLNVYVPTEEDIHHWAPKLKVQATDYSFIHRKQQTEHEQVFMHDKFTRNESTRNMMEGFMKHKEGYAHSQHTNHPSKNVVPYDNSHIIGNPGNTFHPYVDDKNDTTKNIMSAAYGAQKFDLKNTLYNLTQTDKNINLNLSTTEFARLFTDVCEKMQNYSRANRDPPKRLQMLYRILHDVVGIDKTPRLTPSQKIERLDEIRVKLYRIYEGMQRENLPDTVVEST